MGQVGDGQGSIQAGQTLNCSATTGGGSMTIFRRRPRHAMGPHRTTSNLLLVLTASYCRSLLMTRVRVEQECRDALTAWFPLWWEMSAPAANNRDTILHNELQIWWVMMHPAASRCMQGIQMYCQHLFGITQVGLSKMHHCRKVTILCHFVPWLHQDWKPRSPRPILIDRKWECAHWFFKKNVILLCCNKELKRSS